MAINWTNVISRQRETNHLRAIYRWHPIFAGQDFIKYFGDDDLHYDNANVELMLDIGKSKYLAISPITIPVTIIRDPVRA